MRARSTLLAVLGLTLLGAALRFPTLDRQSFWLDELVTVSLLDHGLGDVLREVPRNEATPFVYYVVAWAWGSVFGLGEVSIRTLSALAGTATIPITYAAGAVLVSRRAGIVAAALVAVNPFLVWYSQEARSYALLLLVGAATGDASTALLATLETGAERTLSGKDFPEAHRGGKGFKVVKRGTPMRLRRADSDA